MNQDDFDTYSETDELFPDDIENDDLEFLIDLVDPDFIFPDDDLTVNESEILSNDLLPNLFDETREAIISNTQNQSISFKFVKSSQTCNNEIEEYFNNPFIKSLLFIQYTNKSERQIRNWIKNKQLTVIHNSQDIRPLANSWDERIGLLTMRSQLDKIRVSPMITKKNIRGGFELNINFSHYIIPENRNQLLNFYGAKLQYLLDMFVRSERTIAEKFRKRLIDHINKVPNDNNVFVMMYTYSSNSMRTRSVLSFSYTQREQLISLINSLYSEVEETNYINSDAYAPIIGQKVIDISIIDYRERKQTRVNNSGAFFNYYYNDTHPLIKQLLRESQIFSKTELNNPTIVQEIAMHCLESCIRYYIKDEKIIYRVKCELAKNPNNFIQKNIFKKLTNIINEDIVLVEYDNDNKKISTIFSQGKSLANQNLKNINDIRIKIALFQNHYFPYTNKINIHNRSIDAYYSTNWKDFATKYDSVLGKITAIEWESKAKIKKIYCRDEPNAYNLDIIKRLFTLKFFNQINDKNRNEILKEKEINKISFQQERENKSDIYLYEHDRHGTKVLPKNILLSTSKTFKRNEKEINVTFNKWIKELVPKESNEEREKIFKNLINSIKLPIDSEDTINYLPNNEKKNVKYIVAADTETIKIAKRNKDYNSVFMSGFTLLPFERIRDSIEKNVEIKVDDLTIYEQRGLCDEILIDLTKMKIFLQEKILLTDEENQIDDDEEDNEVDSIIPGNSYKIIMNETKEIFYGIATKEGKLFQNDNCIDIFFRNLSRVTIPKSLIYVYFHNLKFDLSVLLQSPNVVIASGVRKDTSFYSMNIKYNGRTFKFLDSYKIIPKPLSSFGKAFNLEVEKDVLPYTLYTKDFVKREVIPINEIKERFESKKSKKLDKLSFNDYFNYLNEKKIPNVLLNVNKQPVNNEEEVKYINILNHSSYYMQKDIKVLFLGIVKFAKMVSEMKYNAINSELNPYNLIKKIVGNKADKKRVLTFSNIVAKYLGINRERSLNLFNYLTTSSLADDYFKLEGCYNGVLNIKGSYREYLQRTVYGGQTMTAFNKHFNLFAKKENLNQNNIFSLTKGKVETIKGLDYVKELEEIELLTKEIKITKDEELKEKINKLTKKFHFKHYGRYMSDYDAVSCYPSAMNFMDGFPIGNPYPLEKSEIEELNSLPFCNGEHYFKEINDYISKIKGLSENVHFYLNIKFKGKFTHSHFPLFKVPLSELVSNDINKQEKNNKQWENQLPKEGMYLDKYHLEAIIKTHNPEDYEIMSGIYFPLGYNKKINDVIGKLKDMRDMYKKQDNPVQEIIKLLMNSAYGKTLLKESTSKITYFYGTENEMIEKVIKSNSNVTVNELNDSFTKGNYIFSKKEIDFDHINRAHVGSAILGYSKLIMSKPKIIADMIYNVLLKIKNKDISSLSNLTREELITHKYLVNYLQNHNEKEIDDIILTYTDTDSLMGRYENVLIIIDLYKIIFNEDLDGKDFGQFHIDYDMKNSKGDKFDFVFAAAAIWNNKKEYCLILEGLNRNTNEIEYVEKYAYKGINQNRIKDYADQTFPDSKFKIYDLFNSNKIHQIDTIGEDGFKVRYLNKGLQSIVLKDELKDMNLKVYNKTYERFIK